MSTHLSFNDGEGSERATTMNFVHLGGTFEQTGVEVEDIAGVSFTTWGTTKQQGHLTIGNSLFGQIVENDQSVFAVVTEKLSCRSKRKYLKTKKTWRALRS